MPSDLTAAARFMTGSVAAGSSASFTFAIESGVAMITDILLLLTNVAGGPALFALNGRTMLELIGPGVGGGLPWSSTLVAIACFSGDELTVTCGGALGSVNFAVCGFYAVN